MPETFEEPGKASRLALLIAVIASGQVNQAGLPSVTVPSIRQRLPFYSWPPTDERLERARRTMLDHDLERLMHRGMVRVHHVTKGTKTVRVAELQMPEKPEGLFLSPEEHEAISQARAELRADQALPLVSPFRVAAGLDPSQTKAENALDTAWCIVRYLEECGGVVSVSDLSDALAAHGINNPVAVARQALRELDYIDDQLQVRATVAGTLAVSFEEAGGERAVAAQGLTPERQRGAIGTGMDAVSRGAYTPAEVQERLDLIEEALDSANSLDESDRQALRGAHYKLRRWQDLLITVLGPAVSVSPSPSP
jgi:hypothetical protein